MWFPLSCFTGLSKSERVSVTDKELQCCILISEFITDPVELVGFNMPGWEITCVVWLRAL